MNSTGKDGPVGRIRKDASPRRRPPAAAAVVLALAIWGQGLGTAVAQESPPVPAPPASGQTESPLAAEDVNEDGRVDILDAFRLARSLKKDGAGRVREDFNEDGRVNRIDVEILAQRVVSQGWGRP